MKILILNRDYPRFLLDLYASRPDLAAAAYAEQLAARNQSLFGVADFYSHAFEQRGHHAADVHVNNRWLQAAWAREHGIAVETPPAPCSAPGSTVRLGALKGRLRRALLPWARRFMPRQIEPQELRILAAQVEHFAPDVLLNQDMSYVRTAQLARFLPRGVKLVGQIAAALPVREDFTRYDLIVSSLPNFVARFRSLGAGAALSALAFDPRVLGRAPPAARDVPVSFVGSVSADHRGRLRLLESLAERAPLQLWGSGIDELPLASPLRRCYRGEAWGADMFAILRRSRVTINHHIDLAEGYCNNMRMFEATGCGTLMIVDRGRNLEDLFEPAREVLAYGSPAECFEAVEHALADEARRAQIAAAGQRRTLSEHTYARRAGDLLGLFEAL